MSPTTSGRSTAPDTERVRKSISSTVTGTVVAWNDKEIRKVLLHWETR